MTEAGGKTRKVITTAPKFHLDRKWTSYVRAMKKKHDSSKRVHPRGSGKRMGRFSR